jgi:hypothetical protein
LSERVHFPALLFVGGMLAVLCGLILPGVRIGSAVVTLTLAEQSALVVLGSGLVCASVWLERLRRPVDLSTLSKSSDRSKALRDAGLLRIYARRMGDAGLQADIRREIEKEQSEILLMGVALKYFFRTDAPLFGAIKAKVVSGAKGLRVRVLVMDPNSTYIGERQSTGSGQQLVHDIQVSLTNLATLDAGTADVQSRSYNYPATAFLVITSSCVFFEPYFTAMLPGHEGCIGGLVPVLKATNSSTLYTAMKQHFWHTWELHTGT